MIFTGEHRYGNNQGITNNKYKTIPLLGTNYNVRITKQKLKKIIKEEAQKLLREQKQHRPERTIKRDIAYAHAAIAELQDQIKIAVDTPGRLGGVRQRAHEDEIENIENHIRNFEMELKPYHPTAQETYADAGMPMQSVMSPEQEEAINASYPLRSWPVAGSPADWARRATTTFTEEPGSWPEYAPIGQYMSIHGYPGLYEGKLQDIIKEELQQLLLLHDKRAGA